MMEEKSNFIEDETRNEMKEDSFWNKGREIPNDSLDNNIKKSKISAIDINIRESESVDIINDQNTTITDLNIKQKSLKKNLNKIIDDLNNLIDQSSSNLYNMKSEKPDKNNQAKLEKILEMKEKELKSTKFILGNFKQQYDSIYQKANEKISTKRIVEMEDQLEKVKKENEEYVKRIKALKNSQISKLKELEIFSKNKTYPAKVNSLTDEIKNLVGKKHDYASKTNLNKRSIQNMKSYLDNADKNLNEYINSLKSLNRLDTTTESNIKNLETTISFMKIDLTGKEEDILEKMGKDELSFFGSAIKGEKDRGSSPPNKKNNYYQKEFGTKDNYYSKSPINNSSNQTQLPMIKDKNSSIYAKNEKNFSSSMNMKKNKKISILKKFEYLNAKDNNSLPHYMRDVSANMARLKSPVEKKGMKKNNSFKNLNPIKTKNYNSYPTQKSDNQGNSSEDEAGLNDEIAELNYDFENTKNEDYESLLKKQKQSERINEKIEKNYKELDKVYEKKYKEVQNQLQNNKKKAKILQKQNELFAIEIGDLTKIIKLNIEENQLKKELKDSSELKTEKSNNISQTHNEILLELNNLLKSEDKDNANANANNATNAHNTNTNEAKKEKHFEFDGEKVIIEENNETASILKTDKHFDKNQPSNLKMPEISNIENNPETERKHEVLTTEKNLESEIKENLNEDNDNNILGNANNKEVEPLGESLN